MTLTKRQEGVIHTAFEIGIILKGLHAVIEIGGGIIIFFITKAYITSTVLSITQDELTKEPDDAFAHYLINWSNNFSVVSQHFIAFYLLSHGIIKLFLVVALRKEKVWAYPTAIVIFSSFIVYQLYRFYYTASLWLLVLTALDAIVIWLTAHEYRYMKKQGLFGR
jgi:uncharacterized membrane protein